MKMKTFPKGISLNVNVIVKLEFKLTYTMMLWSSMLGSPHSVVAVYIG